MSTPLFLKSLSLLGFKNYEHAEVNFSPRINCFLGNNGEGKTNILDAIHFLSLCKSFFNPIDSQNIRRNSEFMVIHGLFSLDGKDEDIYCGLKKGEKKSVRRNKKEYARLADHIGLLPLVMISPADSELVSEGSEQRRKFMDQVIVQYDKEYLFNLIGYNKVLAQRNALLKKMFETRRLDKDTLEVLNQQLVNYGKPVYDVRAEFVRTFVPIFNEFYGKLSGGKEEVGLNYISGLNKASDFLTLLSQNTDKDRAAQYTTGGIHKDDLEFLIHDFAVKKFGSQGQQKTFLIALKLAQFEFIKKIKNTTPILLLDDIYDKLDETRVTSLMEMVMSNTFGQVIITDTGTDRLKQVFKKLKAEHKLFTISDSNIHEV